jgi:hypothetical protein
MTTNDGSNSQPSHQVPKGKQTILGLYMTAQETYDLWKIISSGSTSSSLHH